MSMAARQNSEDIKALIDSQLLTQHITREQGESIKRLEGTISELAEIVKQLATAETATAIPNFHRKSKFSSKPPRQIGGALN